MVDITFFCLIKFKFKGELNGWMSRLIYGILSLILGSMALLLPETKKYPLPRTMIHVEKNPTSISKHFRHGRSIFAKSTVRSDGIRPEPVNNFNDAGSVVSSKRLSRYDNQSTLHSIYELQDFAQDDTIHSGSNRFPSRRIDSRSPAIYQPYGGMNTDLHRHGSIAEDAEFDEDLDDDNTRLALQRRISEQKRIAAAAHYPNIHTNEDVIIVPATIEQTPVRRQSASNIPSQLEATAQIQSGNVIGDRNEYLLTTDDITDDNNRDKNLASPAPKFQRALSQEENYFSEHS